MRVSARASASLALAFSDGFPPRSLVVASCTAGGLSGQVPSSQSDRTLIIAGPLKGGLQALQFSLDNRIN